MQTGTIKTWNADRGFGFLQPDDGGADLFVHIKRVVDDVEELRPGQRVQFEPGINPRSGKTEARDVKLIEV